MSIYCRYCHAENPPTGGICVSCGKPLSAASRGLRFKPKRPVRSHRGEAGGPRRAAASRSPVPMSQAAPASQVATDTEDRGQSQTAGPVRHARYRFPAPALAAGNAATESVTPPADGARPAAAVAPTAVFLDEQRADEEADMLAAARRRKRRPLAFRLARAGAFAVCLLLLLTGGLFMTLWIEDNGGMEATAAMVVSNALGQPQRRAGAASVQFSRHELPYDGWSEEDADRMMARAAIPIDRSVLQDDDLKGAAEAADGRRKSLPAEASSSAAEPAASGADASGDGEPPAATGKVESSGASGAPDAAKAGIVPAKSVVKPPPPRDASSQKVIRGKEISRIQRQAREELKKKTSSRRDRTAARKTRITLAQLARCERIDGLFRREQCKWKVCGGRWGVNGCPSYAQNTRWAAY
jgi:hypothetical protein